MRRLSTHIVLFLFVCNLLSLNTQSQPINTPPGAAPKDSLPADPAYALALRQYHDYLKPEPNLYRGGQYAGYHFSLESGHPYFGEEKMRKGTISYNGILYKDILLVHDLVQDIVIINDPTNIYMISLIPWQVDRFTIEDHLFIRLSDSLNPSAPRNGFYEQLYKGHILLLKKERKKIEDDVSSPEKGLQHYISSTTSYYLKKGDTYYSIGNKRSLIHALGDRSGQIRKFIRKNGLSLRKDKDNTLQKVVAWYDGNNH